jgi:hypothetical protein
MAENEEEEEEEERIFVLACMYGWMDAGKHGAFHCLPCVTCSDLYAFISTCSVLTTCMHACMPMDHGVGPCLSSIHPSY